MPVFKCQYVHLLLDYSGMMQLHLNVKLKSVNVKDASVTFEKITEYDSTYTRVRPSDHAH